MGEASSASDIPAWMGRVAGELDRRLGAAGIRLTLGGEPTYVPLEPSGAEWSVAADGPTKLPMARAMARELQRTTWPGSTLLYCPGKRYEGEVNPRWALRLVTGLDGQPAVRWPAADSDSPPGVALAPADGPAWLAQLAGLLGVTLEPLELRDPLDPGRRVWAVPLSAAEPDPDLPTAPIQWLPAAWPLDESLRQLSGAPGPAGLRLPLEHFPEGLPRQVLTLETDGESWDLFLPPLFRRPLTALLQAVADSLAGLAPPQLSGMLPVDWEGHWQMLGLTADPGVLEINLPICYGWTDYDRWLRLLERAGERVGLRSWKQALDGRQEGTGGGNHLLWGGPSLEEHPFFRRPGWLAGILRYWQHHPALAYLFSGACVGPASQAPRADEAAGDSFDLELAYRALEQADDGSGPDEPGSDQRGVIGETLRHLHADRSGNNHRSEISFDKFLEPRRPRRLPGAGGVPGAGKHAGRAVEQRRGPALERPGHPPARPQPSPHQPPGVGQRAPRPDAAPQCPLGRSGGGAGRTGRRWPGPRSGPLPGDLGLALPAAAALAGGRGGVGGASGPGALAADL
jgi:uncharacterized protein (DUF2126 family)